MMSKIWQPWDDFKMSIDEVLLPIDAPPCPDCRYWKPVRLFNDNGNYSGVRLCQADEQEHDFSCYHAKGEAR